MTKRHNFFILFYYDEEWQSIDWHFCALLLMIFMIYYDYHADGDWGYNSYFYVTPGPGYGIYYDGDGWME